MDKISVGNFIAEQRKLRSMTQKQLAEKLNVTDKAVSRWETGKGYPDIETIEELAKIFNITINDILSGKINEPEEKEKAAEENIIDALREILRVKKKGIIRTAVTALVFCFIITIIVPALYFTLIPDLRKGNYIVYNDRYYSYIDTNKVPSNFTFFAQESGLEGEIIGREGIGLIRKTDYENVIYNFNTIGSSYVYALFQPYDIPTAKEAMNYTVSMRYLAETPEQRNFSDDVEKVTTYLENIQSTTPVDYFSISNGIGDTVGVAVNCEEFAGYYLLGYIYTCENGDYFRPVENLDNCYKIELSALK